MAEWRWVPGWEGRYEVSDDGRIRSWVKQGGKGGKPSEPRELSQTLNNGYPFVQLWRGNKGHGMHLHRAVAMAFVDGYEPGLDVRHADGTRTNNRASNLSWGTRQQNVDDAVAHGTALHRAKLNALEVRAIRAIVAAKEHYRFPLRRDIAAAFGIAAESVTDITSGRTWSHVDH